MVNQDRITLKVIIYGSAYDALVTRHFPSRMGAGLRRLQLKTDELEDVRGNGTSVGSLYTDHCNLHDRNGPLRRT